MSTVEDLEHMQSRLYLEETKAASYDKRLELREAQRLARELRAVGRLKRMGATFVQVGTIKAHFPREQSEDGENITAERPLTLEERMKLEHAQVERDLFYSSEP